MTWLELHGHQPIYYHHITDINLFTITINVTMSVSLDLIGSHRSFTFYLPLAFNQLCSIDPCCLFPILCTSP